MTTRFWLPAVLIGVLSMVRAADAQDALQANPATVHLKLDNERTRVLESRLPPGAIEKVHSHPPCIVYVIKGGRIRNHFADGRTVESELKDGEVAYRDAVTHWGENIGTSEIHVILVELK